MTSSHPLLSGNSGVYRSESASGAGKLTAEGQRRDGDFGDISPTERCRRWGDLSLAVRARLCGGPAVRPLKKGSVSPGNRVTGTAAGALRSRLADNGERTSQRD